MTPISGRSASLKRLIYNREMAKDQTNDKPAITYATQSKTVETRDNKRFSKETE